MQITLNGAPHEIEAPATVGTLLANLGLAGHPVVVEHNQIALLPRETQTTSLQNGDVLEIIQITAGG